MAQLQSEMAEAQVESPLTRARRIDAQNTWREQQLSKFFVNKSEVLKTALDSLKKEPEQTAPIAPKEPESIPVVQEKVESEAPQVIQDCADEFIGAVEPPTLQVPMTPEFVQTPLKTKVIPKDSGFVTSPLKGRSVSPIDLGIASGPASPGFISALDIPTLIDTEIPDEILIKPHECTSTQIPSKRETVTISEEERLKRQRLKERQQQALEKRSQLIKKAQENKAKVGPAIDD